MKKPTLDDLQVLNLWPPGTVGELNTSDLLDALLDLCHAHGFGCVSQLTQRIEDIWRNPERTAVYAEAKDKHLALVARNKQTFGSGGEKGQEGKS